MTEMGRVEKCTNLKQLPEPGKESVNMKHELHNEVAIPYTNHRTELKSFV